MTALLHARLRSGRTLEQELLRLWAREGTDPPQPTEAGSYHRALEDVLVLLEAELPPPDVELLDVVADIRNAIQPLALGDDEDTLEIVRRVAEDCRQIMELHP